MSKTVITTLALLVWILGASVAAQNPMTGTWTASISSKDDTKLQLNLERRNDKGKRHQSGQGYEFSDLQGLSREQAQNGGPVSFSLVREAGRVDLEGNFQNGKGSGTFRFTPNAAFVSAMRSRGFDFQPDSDGDFEDRLLTAATLNITTALADDLVSAFGKLDIHDLFKAAIFKIDSQFAREMKASGFNNLGMEELVKARIFKIDAKLVREVAQMGFANEPFESLVKMQIFKVTPEFIAELRSEGLNDLKVEDIVKLRIFKIDVDYIRKAKAEGAPTDVESLVHRKIGLARHR